MKVDQQTLWETGEIRPAVASGACLDELVLVFGSRERLTEKGLLESISAKFPRAYLTGCSTSGEITRDGSLDGIVTVTSLGLARTRLRVKRIPVASMEDSFQAGSGLGRELKTDDIAYVLVISDGLHVNGSEVVRGLRRELKDDIIISGGLAGDGANFSRTVVIEGAQAYDDCIVGVGFYGSTFAARSSSASGWEPFGPFRKVTKSRGSVVFEIDGGRALDVYSKYLGDEASQLPSSGLYYPLALRIAEQDAGLIRTLLAVDHEKSSLTFAGDVPEGSVVRLMHATNTQLIEGAGRAGSNAVLASGIPPQFALLISCVGRKLVMGTHTDLEIEAVAEKLPDCPVFAGFHSYGEIGFYEGSGTCELHNQTMTVTTMAEEEG